MSVSTEIPREKDIVTSSAARKVLAATGLATGFVFLWAVLDKAFGLGYSTPAERAWINGGTPAQGFLMNALPENAPLTGFFQSLANPMSDVLFMLGMFGVGLAVMLGIGTRVAATVGTFIMGAMWLAEWPIAPGSTNPLIEYHVVYALVLILVAVSYAGDTWGLGKWWKSLGIVKKQRWLI